MQEVHINVNLKSVDIEKMMRFVKKKKNKSQIKQFFSFVKDNVHETAESYFSELESLFDKLNFHSQGKEIGDPEMVTNH